MNRILVGMLIFILVFAAVGCGGGTNSPSPSQNAAINAKLQAALGAQWASQDAVTKASNGTVNLFGSSSSQNSIRSLSLIKSAVTNLQWSGPDGNGWYNSSMQETFGDQSVTVAIKYQAGANGGCTFTFTCSTANVYVSITFGATEDANQLWSGSISEDVRISELGVPIVTTHISCSFKNSSLVDGTGTYDYNLSVTTVPVSLALNIQFVISISNGMYQFNGTGTLNGSTQANWTNSWSANN